MLRRAERALPQADGRFGAGHGATLAPAALGWVYVQQCCGSQFEHAQPSVIRLFGTGRLGGEVCAGAGRRARAGRRLHHLIGNGGGARLRAQRRGRSGR